jgi:hypothetical protein
MIIIDDSFAVTRQGYQLTRFYLADGRILRVRVYRDTYQLQSWASAQVLTPVLTWTDLTDAPAARWHPATPTTAPDEAPLAPVADALADRATALLIAHRTGQARPQPRRRTD